MNIFTRSLTDDLASLVKKLDAVVGDNADQQAAGFLVLLTDDPDEAEEQLKKFGEEHGIQNIPLTYFDGVSGPPRYKIAEGADLTVHMWKGVRVQANQAFAEGELDADGIAGVVADTKKILN